MPFSLYQQHLDAASGMHVIELRDEHGHQHIMQIAVGHEACPACGHAHAKDNLGEIDPKAMVAQVSAELDRSRANMLDYAQRHNLPVK